MNALVQISALYCISALALFFFYYFASKTTKHTGIIFWSVTMFFIVTILATFTRFQLVPFNSSELRREVLLTGDEPAYLMTALSIAQDGDMDLANNFANKDYKLFQSRRYSGSGFNFFNTLSDNRIQEDKEDWGDSRYMRHRPGTSVLLSPAFFLADHNQRFWAYTIISFLFALFCCTILYYTSRFGKTAMPVILIICMVCGLSPPIFFYTNQAYPEVPAGILLALTGMFFLRRDYTSLLPFLLAAMAIWFTDRIIPAILILCAGGFFSLQFNKQKIMAVTILGTSGLIFAIYCMHRFGIPYPISHNTIMGFSYSKIPIRLVQILFDGASGWFWFFPPLLLLPAIFCHILKKNQFSIINLCLVASLIVTLAIVAAFDDWAGGTCPNGRYFVIPQFLFILLAIAWLQKTSGRNIKLFWLVFLGAIGITQIYWLALHPNWWYRAYHPMFAWEDIQPLYSYLPRLPDNADTEQWFKLIKMAPILAIPSLSCIIVDLRGKK